MVYNWVTLPRLVHSFIHSFSKRVSCFPWSRGTGLRFSLLFKFQMVRTPGAENTLVFVNPRVPHSTQEKLLCLWSRWLWEVCSGRIVSPVSSSVKLLKSKTRKGPFPAAVCKTGILILRVGVSGISQGTRVSCSSSSGICSSWCLALLSFPPWLLLSAEGCEWLRSEQRGGSRARHGSAGLLKRVHF